MAFDKNPEQLQQIAAEIRIDIIKMISRAGSGHPAGSLGMTDVITAFYFNLLTHRPDQPNWPDRDYLLLSNGHICPALYAALAKAGYFESDLLASLRQINSPLQGHPLKDSVPGIENNSGPLGQGLSQACGLALALKHDQKKNHVYCLCSDGEQQEGQVWESYMFAAKYQLHNLTVVIDRNMIQIEGQTEEVMPLENLEQKISAFGWQVDTINGHDFSQILSKIQQAKQDQAPTAIIAQTIPGKGVDFMEGDHLWHGQAPDQKQAQDAIQQLQV